MSTAVARGGPTRLATRIADGLVLASVLLSTWLKLSFPLGVDLSVDDLLMAAAAAWIAGERATRRDARIPAPAAALLALSGAMLVVYLAGYGAVETDFGLGQYAKGLAAWLIHTGFAVAAVAHIAERGRAFWMRCLRWFVIGFAVNGAYAAVQLALGFGGVNIDKILIAPFFGGAPVGGATMTGAVTTTDAFGQTSTTAVLRPTGLTVDPNHLGVMLAMPVTILAALVLGGASPAVQRRRGALGTLLGLALLAQALTQSRSAVLADLVGLGILAVAYRRRLRTRAILVPLAVLAVAAAGALWVERGYVERVLQSRTQTSSQGTQIHTQLYQQIPKALDEHPLFGIGLNQFSIWFSFTTDRDKLFGPHSFIVATLTETGVVGGIVVAVTLWWLCLQALALRRRVRGSPEPDDDRPAIAWGLIAAIAATFAGNVFYLTMVHNSWWCLLVLVAAAPPALAPAPARAARRAPSPSTLPGVA